MFPTMTFIFTVEPVIRFDVNPTPEEVALADTAGSSTAAIPTQSGVVILLENTTMRQKKKKK